MIRYFTFISLLLVLSACKQDISPEEQVMYDKVMVIHDEVMPKIKTINKKEITLQKLEAKLEDQADKAAVKKVIVELGQAYELMFDWMDKFKKKAELAPDLSYITYLKKEEVRIQKVSDAMLNSIAKADILIQKHK